MPDKKSPKRANLITMNDSAAVAKDARSAARKPRRKKATASTRGRTRAGAPRPRVPRDADGVLIRVGCLVECFVNANDFGRVEYVAESIVLYRQLGAPEIQGHNRGDLCAWDAAELKVVEEPTNAPAPVNDDEGEGDPLAGLDPIPRAALTLAAKLATVKAELELACSCTTQESLQKVAKEAAGKVADAITEVMRMAGDFFDVTDASGELSRAFEQC